jgi:hypothetical protein
VTSVPLVFFGGGGLSCTTPAPEHNTNEDLLTKLINTVRLYFHTFEWKVPGRAAV